MFLLVSFRDFVINTHPLWELFCVMMTFFSPIFLTFFVRNRCLALLLGGCSFALFSYLEMTYACFTMDHSCNTNDIELSIYYDMFIGTIYSIVVFVIVRLTIAIIQERKQRQR
jgi:hypothetical protein